DTIRVSNRTGRGASRIRLERTSPGWYAQARTSHRFARRASSNVNRRLAALVEPKGLNGLKRSLARSWARSTRVEEGAAPVLTRPAPVSRSRRRLVNRNGARWL